MIVNDYFIGNGTSTWYMLTHYTVDPNRVAVSVDGAELYYGHNFVINGNQYLGFIDKPVEGSQIHAEYEGTPYE